MTRAELVAVLEAERQRAHDAITDAYWRFSRGAKVAPPSTQVPWAYALRREMEERLRAARRRR
jgi:hypothetical protein